DPKEINQIYESTIDVLSEKYYKTKIFPENDTLYKTLFSLIQYHVQDLQHVHYDALLLFGLKILDIELTKEGGFGIDEIKRKERTSIYYSNKTCYTNMNYSYYSNTSSNRLSDVVIEYNYLASILALTSEKVYVYTERTIEGKVNTLCKIFQENMTVLESNNFP